MADSVEQVNTLVHENGPITVTDIAKKLDISYESIYFIVREDLEYHKICARWEIKEFTDEHKWACVDMCMQFLQQYHEDREAFLQHCHK
jgi:hypothetical protein